MSRLALLVFALAAAVVCAMSIVKAQAPDGPDTASCLATRESPFAICFAPEPLTVTHCEQTVEPHFAIDVWNAPGSRPVGYRYSYQLIVNNVPQGIPVVVSDPDAPDSYPFTGQTTGEFEDPGPGYSGTARYQVRVAVFVKGQDAPVFQKDSPELPPLEDKARIRGLAIGISHYKLDSQALKLDLNYADADATDFKNGLTEILKRQADVHIELLTSGMAGSDVTLGKYAIIRSLEKVAEGEQLCGPNDWFVFYFSGHGIVGKNHQEDTGRYLSTKLFDPGDLTTTAIRLNELTPKLEGTGATNLLVVLDSCFSGFHTKADSSASRPQGRRGARAIVQPAPEAKPSGKVKYVAGGTLQRFKIGKDNDGGTLPNSKSNLERSADHPRHAWFLSAAGGDEEAEEGLASYIEIPGKGMQLEFVRASIDDNKGKPGGHGLFTFSFLANLISQLPAGVDGSTFLAGGLTPEGSTCKLNFEQASNNAKTHIGYLAVRKSWELQTPEALSTEVYPPTVPCNVTAEVP